MHLKPDQNIEKLAKSYFFEELGLMPEEIRKAGPSLVGAFEVLLRIQERLDRQGQSLTHLSNIDASEPRPKVRISKSKS